ncbi:MATE family efflux transporter [uncultured Intestinimonas sp.]|uniref:MATE family efflux transporter n=1 Tax=uncultured Intestinimonas sp. TaxID=1689265 RepID=UPI0025FAC80F|nr:MATE family efflux transporter [uncultured Intestinimonas sp.]
MDDARMGTMPVRPLLLRMAWPMMLSMLIQALYNLVDSMFVSRLSGEAFQALSLAYPVQMFMVAVCVGVGVGLNALLSKRLGQGDRTEAKAVALNGIFLYLLCYLLFLSFALLLTRPFMAFFTADPTILSAGRTYLTIVTGISVGMTMQFATERILLACGDPVGPMVIQGVGAVVNLIMDPILIFGLGPFPALGVAGAAIATVMGQWTGMAVGFLLLSRLRRFPLSPKGFRPRGDILAELCRIGIPAAAMQSLSSVMTLGLNKIMALYDPSAVFILGAYFKLQTFLIMPVAGLTNGLTPLVAYNYGARSRERILALTRFALFLGAAIMAVGTALLLFIPGPLLGLFGADQTVLNSGIPALRWIAVGLIFSGLSTVLCAVFQALGAAMTSLVISLLRQVVLILPAAYLLGLVQARLIWLSFPLAEVLACLAALIFFRRIQRKKLSEL